MTPFKLGTSNETMPRGWHGCFSVERSADEALQLVCGYPSPLKNLQRNLQRILQ